MKSFNAGAWALVAAVAVAGIITTPFALLGGETGAALVLIVGIVSGVATFRMLRRRAKHSAKV